MMWFNANPIHRSTIFTSGTVCAFTCEFVNQKLDQGSAAYGEVAADDATRWPHQMEACP